MPCIGRESVDNPHTDPRRLILFETADIVRELTNRFPGLVIGWVENVDGEPDARKMRYELGGDHIACMGLAAALVQLTNRRFHETVRCRNEESPDA